MEVAGLVLGVVTAIDTCIKYGRWMIEACNDFKNAGKQIEDVLLSIKALWHRLEHQMLVLRRIAPSLSADYQNYQQLILDILKPKLKDVHDRIDKFKVSDESLFQRKFKYALYRKEALQKSAKELEAWYERWDPSWFLIARLAGKDVDAEIRHQRVNTDSSKVAPLSILGDLRQAHRANADANSRPFGFLSENVIFYLPRPVKLSTATVSARSDTHAIVILDNIRYRPETSEIDLSNDVQKLARVLSKLDPLTCNLLTCTGVKRNVNTTGKLQGFSLVFQMPPVVQSTTGQLTAQTSIRSLRDQILHGTSPVSLTHRLKMAKSLARAVIFLHSASFVHKNIRPETILTTESGASYLVGFQRFRAAAGHTYMLGDALWHQNLYQHPTRQGVAPEEMYTMQHDVYSLGICLLEIGLWSSFVQYAIGPNGEEMILPGSLEIASVPKMRDERKRAFELKRMLVELAGEKLPSLMGDRYTALVVLCLTCLDKDAGFDGMDGSSDDSDGDDDDGIAVGVRYIEKILGEIEEISV